MKRVNGVFDPVIIDNDPIVNVLITSDVFPLILSILTPKDIKLAACVKKSWNIKVVEITRNEEIIPILVFAKYLSTKIESLSFLGFQNQSQIKQLLSIECDPKILNCIYLSQIKPLNEDLREEILNILKTLKFEHLEILENLITEENLKSSKDAIKLRTPPGFEKLCKVAKIYNKIDSNLESLAKYKDDAFFSYNSSVILRKFCIELTKLGFDKKSLKTAEILEDEDIKSICLSLLIEKLDDKAIEFAKMTTDFKTKGSLSLTVSKGSTNEFIEIQKTNDGVKISRKPIAKSNKDTRHLNNYFGI